MRGARLLEPKKCGTCKKTTTRHSHRLVTKGGDKGQCTCVCVCVCVCHNEKKVPDEWQACARVCVCVCVCLRVLHSVQLAATQVG